NGVSGSISTVCNLPFTLREILLTANLLSASWGSIVNSHSSFFVDARCSGGEGWDSGSGTVNVGVHYWRRGRDLNPRYPLRYVRFRGGSFQPLTHLSAPKPSSVFGKSLMPDCHRLATVSKECLQHLCATPGQDPGTNLHPVIQLGMIQ